MTEKPKTNYALLTVLLVLYGLYSYYAYLHPLKHN
jgi:hypothetical protein